MRIEQVSIGPNNLYHVALDQLMTDVAQCAKIPRGIDTAEAALDDVMDLQALPF